MLVIGSHAHCVVYKSNLTNFFVILESANIFIIAAGENILRVVSNAQDYVFMGRFDFVDLFATSVHFENVVLGGVPDIASMRGHALNKIFMAIRATCEGTLIIPD